MFFRENGMSFSPGFMTANDGAEEQENQGECAGGLGEGFMSPSLAVSSGLFQDGENGDVSIFHGEK